MKRFLTNLALFILLIITLLIIIIKAINKFDDKYHNKYNRLAKELKVTEILITGDSHSLFAIDPDSLGKKAANISESSKPIEIDLYVIEKNIEFMHSLKAVIIPIDYFTLFFDGRKEKFTKRYFLHWGIPISNSLVPLDINNTHFGTCGLKLLKDMKNGRAKISNYYPHGGNWSETSSLKQNIISRKRLNIWNKKWIDTSNETRITDKLISFSRKCEKYGIDVYLISMPVSKNIFKLYDKKIVERTRLQITKILKETNCSYTDFNNFAIFKADSLYSDPDHLNRFGAQIITHLIKSQLSVIFSANQYNLTLLETCKKYW